MNRAHSRRFSAPPPSDHVSKVALHCWITSEIPSTSESLQRSLRMTVAGFDASSELPRFFHEAVVLGVGAPAFMDQVFHELEADDILNHSLSQLLQFVHIATISSPEIVKTRPSMLLRYAVSACQRQLCSGKQTHMWPVMQLTFGLLG